MRLTVSTIFFTLLLMLIGCGESSSNDAAIVDDAPPTVEDRQEEAAEAETPQEAAAAIVDLLENEDYETLVLERYSEWERTKNMPESGSPEEALEKGVGMFERHRDQMIQIYEQLAEAEFTIQKNAMPQPGETDTMAVAKLNYNGQEKEAKLYLMESGRWGFHL